MIFRTKLSLCAAGISVLVTIPAQAQVQAALLASQRTTQGCVVSKSSQLVDKYNWEFMYFNPSRNEVLPLNKVRPSVHEAFELLAATPSGFRVLQRALPLMKAGKLQIFFDAGKLSPSSIAEYHNDTAIIYLDPETPLGDISISLFHELVHALDDENLENYRAIKKRADELERARNLLMRKEMRAKAHSSKGEWKKIEQMEASITYLAMGGHFRAERKAWRATYTLINELEKTYPCYADYLKARAKTGDTYAVEKILPSDIEIVHLYGLDPKYVLDLKSEDRQVLLKMREEALKRLREDQGVSGLDQAPLETSGSHSSHHGSGAGH